MQAVSEFENHTRPKINLTSSSTYGPRTLNSVRSSKINYRANSSRTLRNYSSVISEEPNLKSDFTFKLVSEAELQSVIKRVRRANQRKRDEENWKYFLKRKEEKQSNKVADGNYCDQVSRGSGSCRKCGLLEGSSNKQEIPKEEENEIREISCTSSFEDVSVNDNISHTYQLGPGLMKRLQDLKSTIDKMPSLLLNSSLHTQYEDEDVDRTIKRCLEFDAMFARNHLYEIQRLLKDTKQLLSGKAISPADLEAKISSALKSVTQALQVYTRHVSTGSRVKYQQVVPIFQSVTSIHGLLELLTGHHNFPMRKEIEVSCSYVKQILLEISVTETKTVSTASHKPAKVRHKHKPSADLSMYNRRHKAEWKRKSAALARVRFGAPNKKKQAHAKENASSKDISFRNSTRAVPEEQVATMMETIPQEESPTRSRGGVDGRKPLSAKSSAREASNVQYLCLTERTTKVDSLPTQAGKEADVHDSCTNLIIGETDKEDALEYHRKMTEYHMSSPHYKDGKAVGIVERLTNRILTEMLMDFQRDEMDQVVRTLYNLEFE